MKLPRIHLEVMKGTREQALTYCQKEGDYKLLRPELFVTQQGKRSDLQLALDVARSGKTLEAAVEDGDVRNWQCLQAFSLFKARALGKPKRRVVLWL